MIAVSYKKERLVMNEENIFQPQNTPKSTPEKRKRKLNIPALVLLVLSMILLTGCILLAVRCKNLSKQTSVQVVEEEKEVLEEDGEKVILDTLKSRLSSGGTVMTFLQDYYPDNIVYVDDGHYIFADKISSLAKNNFENGTFQKDSNNEITYSENGTVITHKGIDVSQFQGNVDYAKVKAAGVEYAIIRLGFRGYGSGTINDDPNFTANMEGALQNDIQTGVYFFTQAITKEEAVEEADYVIDKIKPYRVTYPIVLDVEEIVGDTYRQQNLTKDQLTDVIIAFCERVKEKGYTPMIYGNLKCFIGKIDLTRLESYDKWFAYYGDKPYYPYEISMWQYTESGTIDGIDGKVDFNISFKKFGN